MVRKIYKFQYTEEKSSSKGLEKDFYKILINAFYGKTMEIVRKRCKIEIMKKDDTDKIIKQQSKLTLNGIQMSYENCDSYTFKQNEVLMYKPIYLGFSILELNNFLLYETYYDNLIIYNHILDQKKFFYIIWILIVSY